MNLKRYATVTAALMVCSSPTSAEFVFSFDSDDFGITSNFNLVGHFSFEISFAGDLVAGGVYQDPVLNSVDYALQGSFPNPTPSGFSTFAQTRSIAGADFYTLSPEAGISFAVAPGANLADGLQVSELTGAGTVFTFNAREFQQDPGRYHPPIFT